MANSPDLFNVKKLVRLEKTQHLIESTENGLKSRQLSARHTI